MKRMFFASLVALALIATPAFAATIDLAPAIQSGLELIFGAVSIVLTALIGRFVHGEQEARLRQALLGALDSAAAYAVEKVHVQDWTKIETKNALLAMAASYVTASVPKALAWFKIDDQRLADMLLSRIAGHDPEPGNWSGTSDVPRIPLAAANA